MFITVLKILNENGNMTQGNKELLLKDLCARLPYGVKFACNKNVYTAKGLDLIVTDEGDWEYAVTAKGIAPIEIDFIKPYLFPLSSMSEEQKNELCRMDAFVNSFGQICFSTYDDYGHELMPTFENAIRVENWLNKNNFDYRGLIPKGFANDATGLNIY